MNDPRNTDLPPELRTLNAAMNMVSGGDGVAERGPVRSTKPEGRLTRMVEGDLLAEYRYCEASFNGMRDHALELEAERDTLRAQVVELAGVLRDAEALRPRMLKDFGYVPEYVLEFCNKARAVLYKVRI